MRPPTPSAPDPRPSAGSPAGSSDASASAFIDEDHPVDKYDEAARKFLGKPAAQIAWTTKIERSGVMDLIAVSDVTAKLDALMSARMVQ